MFYLAVKTTTNAADVATFAFCLTGLDSLLVAFHIME